MTNSPMSLMLATAAASGTFTFDRVCYDRFLAFVKRHSPKLVVRFGKKDPTFEAELKRLAEVANQEFLQKRAARRAAVKAAFTK